MSDTREWLRRAKKYSEKVGPMLKTVHLYGGTFDGELTPIGARKYDLEMKHPVTGETIVYAASGFEDAAGRSVFAHAPSDAVWLGLVEGTKKSLPPWRVRTIGPPSEDDKGDGDVPAVKGS
jgi:hypothetical protein